MTISFSPVEKQRARRRRRRGGTRQRLQRILPGRRPQRRLNFLAVGSAEEMRQPAPWGCPWCEEEGTKLEELEAAHLTGLELRVCFLWEYFCLIECLWIARLLLLRSPNKSMRR